MPTNSEAAIVLFSGGQDSTLCLAWALERFVRRNRSAAASLRPALHGRDGGTAPINLVAGMCETDHSGFLTAATTPSRPWRALNLGMERDFVVHTPLMRVDKAATFRMTEEIGGQSLLDLTIEETHTCYLGDRGRHAWGTAAAIARRAACAPRGVAKFRKKP
jgi:7-cyano-7-deazaguanine synthase in queuosine biosynthesis